MGDIVDLKGAPARLETNVEFVTDMCRYSEKILTEQAIKKKYRFDDDVWERLGSNDALIEAIEAEKIRRMRDGSTKREKAQQLVVQAPDVLNGIMLDGGASPRHRVDAIKTLDGFAANSPQDTPATERFIIQINLGDVVETYDKEITIKPRVDPDNTEPASPGALAAFANKRDGNDDEPI